ARIDRTFAETFVLRSELLVRELQRRHRRLLHLAADARRCGVDVRQGTPAWDVARIDRTFAETFVLRSELLVRELQRRHRRLLHL
ncbi:hypothetical protein CPA58_29315, partial [Klebsiella pneumoniae]